MSKALSLLKLFFSLVRLNSTELTPATSAGSRNSTNISSVSSTFTPIILKHVERLSAHIGEASRFQISDDKYYKIEELELELLTKHRGEIAPSSWLRFDKESRAIFFFPLPGNEGQFNYLLVARHKHSNKEIEENIEVRVREQDNPHNHDVVLSTTLNFNEFSTDVMTRFKFVERMAHYCIDRDASSVWLKSYDKEAKTVTVSFNTLGYTPCNLNAINEIKSRMVDSDSQVKPAFEKALSPESRFTVKSVTINLIGPCDPNSNDNSGAFDWGWLKHVLPLLILLVIVGIPVGISCVVRRTRPKRRVAGDAKSRRGQLGQKKEDCEDFGFHTVHFNNKYPSMLSVSMNSKEDALIPNGSPANHSPIAPNRQTRNHNAKTDGTKLNTSPMGAMGKSMVNLPVNRKISQEAMGKSMVNLSENENKKKEVFVGTSEFNFPSYYNFDPNQPQEEEKSTATFESFGEFAEAISSKLKDIKDVGKSVMNVSAMFGQATEGETADGLKPNNTENVQQQVLNNTSEDTKAPLNNDPIQYTEHMRNHEKDHWAANAQYPETQGVILNKQQTPNAMSHVAKMDGQLPTNTDLMQHVMERMSNASSTLHSSNGQIPNSNVSTQNFQALNTSRNLHNTKGHAQNTTGHLHSTKIQMPGAGHMPDTRAQIANAMEWAASGRVHQGNMVPNHVPCTNVNQNSGFGASVSSFNHGTAKEAPLRKSFSQSGVSESSFNHGRARESQSRKSSAPGGVSASNFNHGIARETQWHKSSLHGDVSLSSFNYGTTRETQGGVSLFSLNHGTTKHKSSSQAGVAISNFDQGMAREMQSRKSISQGGVSLSNLNYGTAMHKSSSQGGAGISSSDHGMAREMQSRKSFSQDGVSLSRLNYDTAREAQFHRSSSQGGVSFNHGTANEMQSQKSHSWQSQFNTTPRRKMSVYEPPDAYHLHPAHGQLNRSKSEISLNDTHRGLEQTRVLSKSDLCLYQSTSEVSLYGDYGEIRMRSELSLYDVNEYNHDNNMYETHIPTGPNVSEYTTSEYITPGFETPSVVPSEYMTQDFTLPDNFTSGDTVLQGTMQDVTAAHAMPEYRRSSSGITELPVLTVDDYDFGEKQSIGLSSNLLNRDTTKSMLNLPVGKGGSYGAQYEFGFTPTSSYEDTRSPRESYHEYINPLPVANWSVNHPLVSSIERGGANYNSGGTTYQQVPTDYYWSEAEFEKGNQYKQQPDAYGTFAKSMPNLYDNPRGYSTMPSSAVRNNSSKKHYPGGSEQEKRSLLTKMFSSEKGSESPAATTAGEDATMVGFLKTTVSSLLGPTDGNTSRWFFKNDNAG